MLLQQLVFSYISRGGRFDPYASEEAPVRRRAGLPSYDDLVGADPLDDPIYRELLYRELLSRDPLLPIRARARAGGASATAAGADDLYAGRESFREGGSDPYGRPPPDYYRKSATPGRLPGAGVDRGFGGGRNGSV